MGKFTQLWPVESCISIDCPLPHSNMFKWINQDTAQWRHVILWHDYRLMAPNGTCSCHDDLNHTSIYYHIWHYCHCRLQCVQERVTNNFKIFFLQLFFNYIYNSIIYRIAMIQEGWIKRPFIQKNKALCLKDFKPHHNVWEESRPGSKSAPPFLSECHKICLLAFGGNIFLFCPTIQHKCICLHTTYIQFH